MRNSTLKTLFCAAVLMFATAGAETKSFTITFMENDNNSSNTLKTGTFIDQIESGTEYYAGVDEDITRVYAGQYGLRIGTGSNPGMVTINFSEDWAKKATKIELKARKYDEDKTNAQIIANGITYSIDNDDLNAYVYTTAEFDVAEPVELSSVTLSTSSKRAFFRSFTIYYDDGESSGIEALDATTTAPIYYNLQGVRVANATNGIYVVVEGGKAMKVVL